MPQGIAEPVDESQAALIATCRCRRQIWRLALASARWRHDNWAITCPPPDPPRYLFPLRPDLDVSLALPRDLSADEAERLAAYIRTLVQP